MPRKRKQVPPAEQAAASQASNDFITQESSPVEKTVPPAKPELSNTEQDKGFPIVGIGASAGGLEALEGFFANMPADGNMAFVIIQHLSPTHKSIMADLLQKHTAMRVAEIQDGVEIVQNCIYVTPPDKHVVSINRTLQLLGPVKTHGINLPIDGFFRSLADDQGEKAICIVLSGTGSDGTLGLKAIKGAGGMAMAQTEAQAKYVGMPRSAIDTGLVDFICPVEKMPGELIKYVQHPYIEGVTQTGVPEDQFRTHVHKIFALIRSATGHDFSNYKQTTIRRRIERRMAIHQIDRAEEYVRYLQNAPAEVYTLFKEMLIGVTNFFRDPGAFDILATQVLPDLLARKSPDVPIRIWSPGCATGEEAYSLAILLAEIMEQHKQHAPVQIFGSDLDAAAIESARLAVYPESIAADVPPERLQRFFVKEDNTYKVKKQIRDMVVFAVQNLVKDPPFSRLDLLSCRNLLIYMDAVLQKQLFPLFHYALLPQGVLFLGSSESIGEFTDLFAPVNTKWKIYTRKETGSDRVHEHPRMPFWGKSAAPVELPEKKLSTSLGLQHLAEKIALDNYTAPCVLITAKGEMLYMIGPVDRYLRFTPGEPSVNIIQTAREGLRYKLSAAIQKALKHKKPCTLEGLRIKQNGEFRTIDVLVRPLSEPIFAAGLLMLVFEEQCPPARPAVRKKPAQAADVEPLIVSMEQELQSTKEYLQTMVEELETANEELQSVNEELQSTNEELETSKEELQSTNEELVTVNTELQNKVTELSQVNNDINNLLSSTDIGVIFLDQKLCIKRFTPAIARLFNLIASDIGRPISDITSKITYDRFYHDAKHVLDTLDRKEMEVRTKDGLWYVMRVAPYRTVENIIDGVVITFTDITAVKRAEVVQQNARIYAESIVETVREPLIILDREYTVQSANTAFYRTFQVTPEDTVHKRIYELGNRQWDIPQLHKLLEEIIPQNASFDDYEVEHDFPAIGWRKMLLNARRIEQIGAQLDLILLAIEDVR
jgi:two-component system CheB/CheR fusion protein